jgi:hypothetical protein
MRSAKTRVVLFVGAILLPPAMVLVASDPVGIYCIVDKVVLEPNETSPQRIQIWGTFALWEGQMGQGDRYGVPQRGYLYYRITGGSNGKIERTEWLDMKAIAGTGQGIGFGQRRKPAGRIRPASEKPESPDLYPTGMGLTEVGIGGYQQNMTRVIREIKKAK